MRRLRGAGVGTSSGEVEVGDEDESTKQRSYQRVDLVSGFVSLLGCVPGASSALGSILTVCHDLAMTATALFEPVGVDVWMPTELSRGPWDPRHCHGGPVAALLARAAEHADGAHGWQIARLTIELTRPVPVGADLRLTTTVERPGRKVSLVAAVLADGDTEVARLRTLRIRHADFELPADTVQPDPDAPARPGDGQAIASVWGTEGGRAFHTHSCEHRFVEGGWDVPGPVAVWIRLIVPVVDGEEPSGVQRCAAAADFGNGVSRGIDTERYTFINPDLTIHLLRQPEGEWIGMRSGSFYGADGRTTGAGFAESALFDEAGRVGRSVQSLLVDPRS
jgi:Thioesterase-like superfamily